MSLHRPWSMALVMLPGLLMLACDHPSTVVVPQKYTVEIKEMNFQPADITVHAGDTIEWINDDMVEHDVTEEANKEWTSGRLPPGKSWDLVVKNAAGYFCSIHQVMKAKIEVY